MTSFLRAVLLSGVACTIGGVSAGQAPATAVDTVGLVWAKRLLVAMHAQEALLTGIDSAFASERRANNQQLPGVFFDSLSAHVRRVVPQLVDSLAIVYVRKLSVPDLTQLVSFYESPLGQRYAGAQVAFELESSALGKRWGMRVALDVMKDLLDKGLMPDLAH